ncbi:unnamed protein product [Candida verbasci]|uniref:NAD-dependent epimerase/dehydratase domain-containing protein n=1 Tax=Candida verbasci TaxID=1227364 RepID=A0A9W4TRF6_9ASCO|nr:unnamed protein product [Candida verbasci]
MSTCVLVAGASGYIGKHIVQHLINKSYSVIGQVRTEEKGDRLKSLLNSPNFKYVVIEDAEEKGAFDKLFKEHPEIQIVIDSASPLPIGTNYEKRLIKRTAKGVKAILKSIEDHAPNVKRVVLTSSVAACMNAEQAQDPNFIVDEHKWNPDKHSAGKNNAKSAYFYAKANAEREAWEYMKKKRHFTLSTILPGFTFGPQCFDEDISDIFDTSIEMIRNIFDLHQADPVPDEKGLFVDVRDVAQAHIDAFEKDEAQGKRLIMASEDFSGQEIIDILHKNYPSVTTQLPTGHPNKDYANLKFDNHETMEILNIPCRSLESSIKDEYDQYLRTHGIIS